MAEHGTSKAPIKLISFTILPFIASCWVLLVKQLEGFANDPGVGWHLKTGELIWNKLAVPFADPFLSSAIERPWICDQWLSDLIMFLIFKLGSWPLLYGLGTLLYLFTFAVVAQKSGAYFGGSKIAAAIVALFSLKLGCVHFVLRPVLLSFLPFALVLNCCWAIVNWNRGGGKFPRHLFISLPLILLVWANLHPSFVLGLGLLGALLVSVTFDRILFKRSESNTGVEIKVLLLLGLCVSATFLNPNWHNLHESIFALGKSAYFMSLHVEWRSPNFQSPEGGLFLFFIASFVIGISLLSFTQLGWRTWELILLLGSTILVMRSIRFLPYWSIIAVIPAVQIICRLPTTFIFQKFSQLQLFAEKLRKLEIRDRMAETPATYYLVFSALCLTTLFYSSSLPLYSGQYGPDSYKYPFTATEFALSKSGDRARVVASPPEWGGFFAMYGKGIFRPIIDDRNTLLGEEFYRNFLASLEPGADWLYYFKNNKVDLIVWPRGTWFAKNLENSPSLNLLYKDEVAFVLEMPE